jgi:hypothetical protein
MTRRDKPQEHEAITTTIVGGRPPGCGQPVGAIPRGIEVLVKKAAVDPDFRKQLIDDRAAAAAAIDLTLEPAEVMMLNGVPATQLAQIIDRTHVKPEHRPALLGKVAAVMLATLGLQTLTGCSEQMQTKGIQPDRPEPPTSEQTDAPKSDAESTTTAPGHDASADPDDVDGPDVIIGVRAK